MKVEDRVGIDVLARNCLGPQFLHEEHLVGELWSYSVSGRPSLSDPVRQVTHKVKEEVAIWNTNHCNKTHSTSSICDIISEYTARDLLQ